MILAFSDAFICRLQGSSCFAVTSAAAMGDACRWRRTVAAALTATQVLNTTGHAHVNAPSLPIIYSVPSERMARAPAIAGDDASVRGVAKPRSLQSCCLTAHFTSQPIQTMLEMITFARVALALFFTR